MNGGQPDHPQQTPPEKPKEGEDFEYVKPSPAPNRTPPPKPPVPPHPSKSVA